MLAGLTPGTDASDPAEVAYDEGYRLWMARRYPQAITALRAMASSFPGHRRVSWANNLAGRALLDSGQTSDYRGMPPAGVAVLALPELPARDPIEPGLGRLTAFWWP